MRLACRDYGGRGPVVLCLHGLAGHASEWAEVARLLQSDFRVLALDQRGHGRSEHLPGDLTRAAFVADVVYVVDQLGVAPVVLLGQSMGANTAFLTAARQPSCAAALVVIEGSPDGPAPNLPRRISDWLDRWPVPFADRNAARDFFATEGLAPGPWAEGLERRADGLWPRFNKHVMVDCIADLAARDYWADWRQIQCPTLIVRGEHGNFTAEHMRELAALLLASEAITIRGAGHDVHLDDPEPLARQIGGFLSRSFSP